MSSQFARRVIIAALGCAVALVAPPAQSTTATAGGPAAVRLDRLESLAALAPCPPTVLVCMKLKVEGTNRIAKVGSDVQLVPGEFAARAIFENLDPNWPLRLEGDLTLPTVRGAYLVVLRFMPSTNDIDFIQEGKVTGRGRIVPPPPNQPPGIYVEAEMVARLFVRLSHVTQGGVTPESGIPLEVGGNCRTQAPAAIPINAVLPALLGAKTTTTATFTLPAFAGCGVTENLNPLFTGLVSGPGNVLRSTLTVISIGEA